MPSKTPWWRFDAWRLSSRMALLSLLLLLLVQAAGFVVIGTSIQRNARAQLGEQLAVGERIWGRLLEQRAAKLTQGATVLAADYAFREAVGTHDNPTIVSALDNHGARIDDSWDFLVGQLGARIPPSLSPTPNDLPGVPVLNM